ncbi:hypothetical protein BH11ARM2_BH11ARM2_27640 [soil metagenome]
MSLVLTRTPLNSFGIVIYLHLFYAELEYSPVVGRGRYIFESPVVQVDDLLGLSLRATFPCPDAAFVHKDDAATEIEI